MNFVKRKNRKGDKIFFAYDIGREAGQRPSTGLFIYARPKNQIEKSHNKETLALLEVKKSQLILERQAIGSGYIPAHKFKQNFLDYYEEYVKMNKRTGNRHLECSFEQFKTFLEKDFLSPVDLTENLCLRFRQHLLDHYTGDTPANYYARFKRVLKAATKDGYYRHNPTEDVKTKSNPSSQLKENLEANEYIRLLKTPCLNQEVQEAFIVSCYTALRYVDVKSLNWSDIKDGQLTTRIIQRKTGQPVVVTLHPVAQAILDQRRKRLKGIEPTGSVFYLPSHKWCMISLDQWTTDAGINKHVTWHCARLSFSILLQDKNVDAATVALLLGQTTTRHVYETYKRHRPKDQSETINQLPMPDGSAYYLHP